MVDVTDKGREIRERNRLAEALIREWLADESGYDEATWPELVEALDESRRAVGAGPLRGER
ncbi:MAG: hypothetical protein HS104_09085 [Polyangiaceae bacterium]|nr:hypothetical protein [Polyangiaceae bacterium]MCL4756463.1 hypothetical protein [Myxococcales bacterium]